MNDSTIFDFSPLREYLIRKGYKVKEFDSLKGKDLIYIKDPIEAIKNGQLSVRDDGIFTVDKTSGKEYRTYMYKFDYFLEKYGKPKYHICKCKTLEEFIEKGKFNGHYINGYKGDEVPVRNRSNGGEIVKVSDLPLCRNCIEKLSQYSDMTFKEFADLLEKSRLNSEIEPDIFGYTSDWDKISRQYKESKDYTCEKCGLKVSNRFDRMYIHCHHKDGDKLNNDFSNLQCLCIKCHSQVNERHKENFSKGTNKLELEEFEKKYNTD